MRTGNHLEKREEWRGEHSKLDRPELWGHEIIYTHPTMQNVCLSSIKATNIHIVSYVGIVARSRLGLGIMGYALKGAGPRRAWLKFGRNTDPPLLPPLFAGWGTTENLPGPPQPRARHENAPENRPRSKEGLLSLLLPLGSGLGAPVIVVFAVCMWNQGSNQGSDRGTTRR